MLSLLYMELGRVRNHLLMSAAMLAAFTLVSAVTQQPAFALSLFAVLPIVTGTVLPINSFAQEERGNALVFMRSLPLRPWEIVTAKYGATYVAVLVLGLALLVAAPLVPELATPRILLQVSFVTALSLCLCAASYFLLFLLGFRRGRIGGMAVTFAAIILWSVGRQRGWGDAVLGEAGLEQLLALGSMPLGLALAITAGTCAVALSCVASARIFGARDITRMP